jgi:hypothetical protein
MAAQKIYKNQEFEKFLQKVKKPEFGKVQHKEMLRQAVLNYEPKKSIGFFMGKPLRLIMDSIALCTFLSNGVG